MKNKKRIYGVLIILLLVILLLLAIAFAISSNAINGTPASSNNITSNAPTQSASAITTANATFTVGALESFAVAATDYRASSFSTTSTLPPGITLDPTTGILSGAPVDGAGGTYPITITASNEDGSNTTQSFILTVNEAPAITSGSSTTFMAGSAGSFTVMATGYPTVTFSKTGALPVGVTLNSTTGELSGTPAADTGGSYPITITASNGVGTNAKQNFTLTVNQAPAFTSTSSATFKVGSSGSFTIETTGYPAPSFTKTGFLPSGVSLNGTTGELSGRPAAGTSGTYTITVTASNGVGRDATRRFTLTVSQTNTAPIITSTNEYTCTAATGGSFTVTATGKPTPSITETEALPSGVSVTDNGDGTATLTVGAETAQGAYALSFTAANGFGSDATQSFTLTVNRASAITSNNDYTCIAGTGGSFTVTVTGYPAPVITKAGTLPSGVTFTDNGDGTATLSVGTSAVSGSCNLSFMASNGIGSNATQSFTLTVNPPESAPVITSNGSTTFTVGSSGSFTVTATGYPAPNFTVTGTLPSGVTLNATTGVLSGTPAVGTGKAYPITITASNGVGTNAAQSFTLTVNQAPVFTSVNNATFKVGTLGTFTVKASGFPAASFSKTGTLPSGVTLNATTGVLTGTPAAGTSGSYPITITASNGIGTEAVQSFTLKVNQAPAITSGSSTSFLIGSSGSFTFSTTGYPAPTFSKTGILPSGVTLNATTGVLSGTPNVGSSGTYPITVTASNGVSPNATKSFTLTVKVPTAITSFSSVTFKAGVAHTFTVTTSDSSTPAITQTATLPSGVTFHDNANGTATLTIGAATAQGTYNLSFTADNGVTPSTTQSLTLIMNDSDDPAPVAAYTDGYCIYITFNKPMAAPPTPAMNEFPGYQDDVVWGYHTGNLLISDTSLMSGDPYTIALTAGVVVVQHATVTISYRMSDVLIWRVKSADGVTLQNFGPVTVTNNSPNSGDQ